MKVVLVHGFLDRAGIMSGLARHLKSCGHDCVAPSLKPCDARHGLIPLAHQLDQSIQESLPDDTRFALVGFSMGALLCRYCLQELGGHRRVEAFFSIAAPQAGTLTAYLYPGQGCRDMRPGSQFLRDLERTKDRLSMIPTTCYWSPVDPVILPSKSAQLPGASQVRVFSPLHPVITFDRRIYRDVGRRLKAQPTTGTQYAPP